MYAVPVIKWEWMFGKITVCFGNRISSRQLIISVWGSGRGDYHLVPTRLRNQFNGASCCHEQWIQVRNRTSCCYVTAEALKDKKPKRSQHLSNAQFTTVHCDGSLHWSHLILCLQIVPLYQIVQLYLWIHFGKWETLSCRQQSFLRSCLCACSERAKRVACLPPASVS